MRKWAFLVALLTGLAALSGTAGAPDVVGGSLEIKLDDTTKKKAKTKKPATQRSKRAPESPRQQR